MEENKNNLSEEELKKQKMKEYFAKYYIEHKEQKQKYLRSYYQEHKEELKRKRRERYDKYEKYRLRKKWQKGGNTNGEKETRKE